jgi:GNAT superfamily N-acetyltransferase
VVVRRLVRGETGPTGGPAMTDLLGTMLTWGPTTTVVEAESGERVEIALADIVSGKPVPPRPSPRLRVSAEAAERRAVLGWPPVESAPLGDWVLRAADGFSARANSVLALGDPCLPLDDAVGEVRAFYASRGLPAWAQVVSGSSEEAGLVARGWVTARPGEADSEFQIAAVAQVSRALRRLGDRPVRRLDRSTSPTASAGWLADDARAAEHPVAARAVLEGPPEVAFVSVGSPLLAKGRVSLVDDWAGVTDVWVAPEHRRQGLALVVMAALLEWAAERGASTAYLQTRGDNPDALALYGRLGFVTHHTYRYLTPAP